MPGAAIFVLGPSGLALGRRLRALLPGARLSGPAALAGECDETYAGATAAIAAAFAAGRPVIGVCASGILIRAVAPLLADKRDEPPVVAVAEDGSAAVPLLGGHHGGNALARRIAAALGGAAAITTAGDLRLGIALDEPPPGWKLAEPAPVKRIAAALLAGEPVALCGEAPWLRAAPVAWAETARLKIVVSERAPTPDPDTLVYHPPVLAVGIGCARGCPAEEIAALAQDSLAGAGLAPAAVAAVVSVELKSDEPGIHALAAAWGVPARFFSAARLLEETPRLTERSAAAFRAAGCWGVAEGAALAAAGGPAATLVVAKRRSAGATCAVARAAAPLDAQTLGRARGRLAVVGIGPGDAAWRTPEAEAELAAADEVVGLTRYLDLAGSAIAGKTRHGFAIGEEEARARLALDHAAAGRRVALVSSGDAGIYGMAALVCELIERGRRPEWDRVELAVLPGISAMQAAAARAGAPLGHDFCAVSLSDLLTPWAAIRTRLEAAAAGDFVIALYNPRSARRAARLGEAAAILLTRRAPETPVFIARNLGRAGESCRIATLGGLAGEAVDMLSLVIVGNSQTRRDGARLYTPRGYFAR